MTTVTKGKILQEDIKHWDGVTRSHSRKDSTGGTVVGNKLGVEVDVLAAFGNSTNYTRQTIQDCINRIGSSSVTLVFSPGTWAIDDDLTIGSNFVCRVPNGCVFSVSSGKTLTFSGPVIRDGNSWTSGSGTVTENGTRYYSGLVDLTSAVLQGSTPLVFEGSTANAHETRFVITDPTADRTITFPDADVDLGTVVSASANANITGNWTHAGTVTMSGKSLWLAQGANVASTADCNIWVGDGNTVHVTGTTTITDWGTAPQAGAWMRVIFDGALTLTYNATTNDLPGDADLTTASGDSCIVYARSTSSYQIFDYTPSSGVPRTPTITEVATTSGTSVELLSSIPSWVRKIELAFNGVSTDGTSHMLLQLGDAGGYETSGYSSQASFVDAGNNTASSSAGILLAPTTASVTASEIEYGHVTLTLVNTSTFLWVISGVMANTGNGWVNIFGGSKATSAITTSLRVTTVTGTPTFDAGSVSVRLLP